MPPTPKLHVDETLALWLLCKFGGMTCSAKLIAEEFGSRRPAIEPLLPYTPRQDPPGKTSPIDLAHVVKTPQS